MKKHQQKVFVKRCFKEQFCEDVGCTRSELEKAQSCWFTQELSFMEEEGKVDREMLLLGETRPTHRCVRGSETWCV